MWQTWQAHKSKNNKNGEKKKKHKQGLQQAGVKLGESIYLPGLPVCFASKGQEATENGSKTDNQAVVRRAEQIQLQQPGMQEAQTALAWSSTQSVLESQQTESLQRTGCRTVSQWCGPAEGCMGAKRWHVWGGTRSSFSTLWHSLWP